MLRTFVVNLTADELQQRGEALAKKLAEYDEVDS